MTNAQEIDRMSLRRDMIDWVGGFPFEFAGYDPLQSYLCSRGLQFVRGTPASSLGCHELICQQVEES